MIKYLLTGLLLLAGIFASAQNKVIGTTKSVTALTKAVLSSGPGYQTEVLLGDLAGCPHDYSLTPADMKLLSGAKIVVINGGGMEGFLEGVIKRACPNAKIVDASKGILPQQKSGCKNPSHCKHHHSHHNEHILVSPAMTVKALHAIGSQMRAIHANNPEIAEQISKNVLSNYKKWQKLSQMYSDFARMLPHDKKRVLIQHSVFEYLAKEAGFEVKGMIFNHDSQEPSASDAAHLIKKIKKEKIFAIFAERGKNSKMTERIAREAGIPIIYLEATPKTDSPDELLRIIVRDLAILKKAVK